MKDGCIQCDARTIAFARAQAASARRVSMHKEADELERFAMLLDRGEHATSESPAPMIQLAIEMEALYQRLEHAIDAQGKLKRVPNALGEPILSFSRAGVTVRIAVRAPRKRKSQDIWADGDTANAAVESLIRALDFWAQALEK